MSGTSLSMSMRASVLIVEKAPVIRSILRHEVAEAVRAHVDVAKNLQEAHKIIETTLPRLIIAGTSFDDGLGLELLQILEDVKLQVPIIFITSKTPSKEKVCFWHPKIISFQTPLALGMLRDVIQKKVEYTPSEWTRSISIPLYLSLARIGHHSLEIVMEHEEHPAANVIVHNGSIWSAKDHSGDGEQALKRLLFSNYTVKQIHVLDKEPEERDVDIDCESLLKDARETLAQQEQLQRKSATLEAAHISSKHPLFLEDEENENAELLELFLAEPDTQQSEPVGTTSPREAVRQEDLSLLVGEDIASTTFGDIRSSLVTAKEEDLAATPYGAWESVIDWGPVEPAEKPLESSDSWSRIRTQSSKDNTTSYSQEREHSASASFLGELHTHDPFTLPKTQTKRLSNKEHFEQLYDAGIEALLDKKYEQAYESFTKANEIRPEERKVCVNIQRLRELGYGANDVD